MSDARTEDAIHQRINIALGIVAVLVVAIAVFFGPLLRRGTDTNYGPMRCMSNLRQIGLAMKLYANEHDGYFPPDFETTLANEDITPDVFVCESTNDERSPLAAKDRPTTLPVGILGPGHCSYVCTVPPDLKDDEHLDSNVILAYEPPTNHDGDGMNVLYTDDHVDRIDGPAVEWIIAQLKGGHNPPATQPR